MKLNQKGEGRTGLIFGLLILGTIIFLAAKIIPVAIRVFAFEDEVRETAKYLGGKKVNVIQQNLFQLAQKESLPIDLEDIDVQKLQNELRVDIVYTVQITFPGYVYNWDNHVVYAAPIF
jgi:hypothetical protein